LNGNNLTILNNAASNSTTAAGTLTVSGGVTGSGNLIITNNSTNTSVTAGNTGGITLSVGEINNAGTITNSGTANSTAGSVGATTISAVIGSSVTNITQSSTTSNLVLSGANTAAGGFGATGGTGTVTVSNGTLQMGGAAALGGVNAVSVGTSGTFDLNGNSETIAGLNNISSNGGTVTNSGAAKTLTLGGSGSYTFGGTITATTPANLALTVNMTGTQTLSGASSYTGATTVQGGTLIVSGSLSGSSAVTVGSSASLTTSAILAGGGQVGNVTLGAAAGNTGAEVDPSDGVTEAAGTGTTLTTGTFTIAASSASTLALQVGRSDGADHISLGGDSSDKINATSVSLNSSGKLSLSLESGYSITVGDVLYLVISGAAPTGTFASVNGSAITSNDFTWNGYNWEIGYNVTSGGVFSGGDDVAVEALSVAAIPEPGAWAMMLAGTGMLVAIQRSRRRNFKTHRIL
jgi:autotransporter-associated beta strand protein